jgi:hypothetical protein
MNVIDYEDDLSAQGFDQRAREFNSNPLFYLAVNLQTNFQEVGLAGSYPGMKAKTISPIG